MADPTIDEVAATKAVPFKRYEYVTVTFGAANTDLVIPYSILRPTDLESVRWMDVSPTTVYSGGSETVAHVYRSQDPTRLAWGANYIVLRATVANYSTRLLLFLERV
jgi:hypothetical protein